MNTCIFCEVQNPEEYNFCQSCEKQIRCLSCGKTFVKDKSKCLFCGKLLDVEVESNHFNELTLEQSITQKSSSRTFKGKLSDAAITQVAAVLSKTSPIFPSQTQLRKKTNVGQPELPLFSQQDDTEIPEVSLPKADAGKPSASKYFIKNGDTLAAKTIDFKGTNKREQQIRFMLFFVAAFNELQGKPVPTQKMIFDALDSNNMLDVHAKATHYKFTETNYLMQVDGGYAVKLEGEREINLILEEMADASKSGYKDWNKPGKPRSKSKAKNTNDEKINEWLGIDPTIGEFDIRLLKTPTKYSMFGIYVLTKKISVTTSVSYSALHTYLSKKFTHPVKKDAIRKALNRPTNASRFLKTPEGDYYLTPQAEKDVAKWLTSGTVDQKDV